MRESTEILNKVVNGADSDDADPLQLVSGYIVVLYKQWKYINLTISLNLMRFGNLILNEKFDTPGLAGLWPAGPPWR